MRSDEIQCIFRQILNRFVFATPDEIHKDVERLVSEGIIPEYEKEQFEESVLQFQNILLTNSSIFDNSYIN